MDESKKEGTRVDLFGCVAFWQAILYNEYNAERKNVSYLGDAYEEKIYTGNDKIK